MQIPSHSKALPQHCEEDLATSWDWNNIPEGVVSHGSEPTEKLREQSLLLSKCPCGCHCLLLSAADKVQASKTILVLHWKETLFMEPKFLGRKRLASKTCKFPQSTPSDSEDRPVLCVVCPAWGTSLPLRLNYWAHSQSFTVSIQVKGVIF